MSTDLNFSKCEFPSDWQNDVRMNFLFGNFRDRCINPEGYDAKMTFWMNTIEGLCVNSHSPVISLSKLCPALERKGRQPMCIDVVLDNMIKQGKIVNFNEYSKIEPEQGWLGWGFNVLVQKPVSWGFSSVQSLLKSSEKNDTYVVVTAVKNLAVKVLSRYHDLIGTKWTENAVFLESLKQECKDICSESNFQLVIIELQKQRLASVYEEYGEKVVKFRKKDENRVQPLSELDKGILSLNRAQATLSENIDTLDENIISCQEKIKENLKNGLKSKAMFILKKKKRLEAALQKKTVALDNVENLLTQLKNAGSEKMILNAYQLGIKAMKQSTTGEMDLDNVDDIMADLNGALDDYNEIQATISKPLSGDDESLEEFEAELAELMAQERTTSPPRETAKRKSTTILSPTSTDEELMKRLAALRAPPDSPPAVKKPALIKPIRAP